MHQSESLRTCRPYREFHFLSINAAICFCFGQRLTTKIEAAAMNTQQMEQMGQFKITVWEEENFQGKRCEFMLECQNIMERGFNKIRSIKVENGP